MAAMEKLLVDRLVAVAAVGGGHCNVDDEAIVVGFLLARGHLVAIKAVDALFRVGAHLELLNH